MNFFQVFGGRRRFEKLVASASFFTALSFLYSFVGFLHPEIGSHYHEYALGKLAVEIGGHFAFGFVAALPLMDVGFAFLTGSLAVLIDIDHLLSALNFDVSGRPDHSILYVLLVVLFLYISRRLGFSNSSTAKLLFVAPVTLLSHLSFDMFASSGTSFQLLIPFSFQQYYFPYSDWSIFEIAGLLVSVCGLFVSLRLSASVRRKIRVLNPDL